MKRMFFMKNESCKNDRGSFKKSIYQGIYNSLVIIMAALFLVGGFIFKTNAHENEFIVYEDYYRKNDQALTVSSDNKGRLKKTAYLTFDDGPSDRTEEVLDILKENDINATFFLIGNQINKSTKKTLKRLVKEGNQVAVHTYCHEADCIYDSADTYYNDVMKAAKRIKKYTGVDPKIYRFPWGSVNGYIKNYRKDIIMRLKKEGFEYCDWNVSGEDSIRSPRARQIINNVKSNYRVYNEPVILLHDANARKETVKALPVIIKMYKDAGYSFDIIENRNKPCQWKPY